MKKLEKIEILTKDLEKKFGKTPPETAVILGSGYIDVLEFDKIEAQYSFSDFEYLSPPTVTGHKGQILSVKIDTKSILVVGGRIHLYEGHSSDDVVRLTRAMKLWGVKNLILTNAAGGINKSYKQGQLVLIKDHLNFTGQSPLVGRNLESLGERFPDMQDVYSRKWRELLKKEIPNLKEGVYVGVLGPNYETPAEINFFRSIGADLVGMSTVHEAISAKHVGFNTIALSCVTNMASGMNEAPILHKEVKKETFAQKDAIFEILKTAINCLPREV